MNWDKLSNKLIFIIVKMLLFCPTDCKKKNCKINQNDSDLFPVNSKNSIITINKERFDWKESLSRNAVMVWLLWL